ncbi:MAG: sulfate adenylyltransferase, partial [Opitutae bacterium]|nr:sulfate adenylyltransferase [Opitutae bacterium]
EDDHEFGMNDIGRVTLRVSQPLFFDTYRRNRNTGSFILVDPFTSETLAAGMMR